MSQIGWVAGVIGLASGAIVGNAVHPMPPGWRGMSPKPKRMAILKTVAVGSVFGSLGAAIGYALTGCDCCQQGSTPVGAPLLINPTPPSPPQTLPPVIPR